jgi:hypothetical protein
LELQPSQPTVLALFKEVYQYRIPRYQRPYAWELSQIDEYWADITRVGPHGHFLGPMVLHNPGGDEFRWVIDGQQRLTTLQITMALIRDRYIELGDPPRKPGTPSSMAPQALVRHVDYDDQFVLRSGVANREVLEDFILRHPLDAQRKDFANQNDLKTVQKEVWARNKALVAARHRLFENLTIHLNEAAKDRPVEEQKAEMLRALTSLEESLVKRVSLIVLDLSSIDDAFLLFETLNDRGLRLSAADLLKSHLLSKLENENHSAEVQDQAADQWDEMVDDLGGGDITGFLRHYLLMRNERVSKAEVFPLFKQEVARISASATLRDVVIMGGLYAGIRAPSGDDETSVALKNLLGTGVESHRVVLLPGRRWLTEALFLDLVRLVEVLSFRWAVVGLNAQILENQYQAAAQIIAETEGRDYARARSILSAKVPGDREFADRFERQSLGLQYVAAYALRRIEEAYDPSELKIKSPTDVHLEHVMPRTHTPYWLQQVSTEAYEVVVQRWGNLTLLLDKLNVQVGNSEWDVKRFGRRDPEGKVRFPGYQASKINLTKDLVSVPEWTESLVQLRARWLAGLACRVWRDGPGPSPTSYPTFSSVVANPGLLEGASPIE